MWQRSVVLLVGGISALAACTTPAPVDSPHEVTVPALWVSGSPGGPQDAGIERAVVRAATVGPPGFTIDLGDIQAQGAGVQWQAATSVAATVATLFSGRDPRQIDLGYAVTGPIDGPSAGGILTVGSLAAINGDSLDPTVTMTGTVAPDGTIGSVSGIAAKLKAAAAAGFTTLLIPVGSETEMSPNSKPVNLLDLGRKLGVTVRPTTDVTAAYQALTGKVIAPQAGKSVALDSAVDDLVRQQVKALNARFDARLLATSSELTAADRRSAQRDSAAASAALASGKPALAYGTLVLASRALERAAARSVTHRRIAESGLAEARASVAATAAQEAKRGLALIDAGSAEPTLGVEQAASLPFALAPAAYAQASLSSIATGLNAVNDPEAVEAAAADVADQSFTIDVVAPDGVAVVLNSSGRASSRTRAPEFLSGYIDFLNRGSEATLEYLHSVTGSRPSNQPGSASQAAAVLAKQTAAAASTQPTSLAAGLKELSYSVAYFLVSEDLASRQALGLPPPGLEDHAEVRNAQALGVAVASGASLAQRYGSSIVEGGSGVDSALWRSDWGSGQLRSATAEAHPALAGLAALHEQWSAVLNCLLIRASRSESGTSSETAHG